MVMRLVSSLACSFLGTAGEERAGGRQGRISSPEGGSQNGAQHSRRRAALRLEEQQQRQGGLRAGTVPRACTREEPFLTSTHHPGPAPRSRSARGCRPVAGAGAAAPQVKSEAAQGQVSGAGEGLKSGLQAGRARPASTSPCFHGGKVKTSGTAENAPTAMRVLTRLAFSGMRSARPTKLLLRS